MSIKRPTIIPEVVRLKVSNLIVDPFDDNPTEDTPAGPYNERQYKTPNYFMKSYFV